MDTAKIIERYFYEDGSLRDIYLIQTEPKDWGIIFNLLERQNIHFHIYRDGDLIEGDVTIGEITKQLSESSFYLTVELNTISLSGYFNTADFIEFDVTPKEVQTDKALDELISFMRLLAGVTNKEARLTPEMEIGTPYIVVSPNGIATYY